MTLGSEPRPGGSNHPAASLGTAVHRGGADAPWAGRPSTVSRPRREKPGTRTRPRLGNRKAASANSSVWSQPAPRSTSKRDYPARAITRSRQLVVAATSAPTATASPTNSNNANSKRHHTQAHD
jgi:hypothetical protein